jgi:hypothetical protein
LKEWAGNLLLKQDEEEFHELGNPADATQSTSVIGEQEQQASTQERFIYVLVPMS